MDEKIKNRMYKAIKVIQFLFIVILGIILCVYSFNESTTIGLEYIFATILVLYGFASIGFAFIFGKGIISTEIISGALLCSLSIVMFVDASNSSLLMKYIPIFLGSAMVITGALLLTEAIISLVIDKKSILRPTIYIISGLATIVVGSLFLAFWKDMFPILVLIMGITVILIGMVLIVVLFINPKNKQIEAKVEEPKVIETKEEIVPVENNEITEQPKKKRGRPRKNPPLQIEQKDETN